MSSEAETSSDILNEGVSGWQVKYVPFASSVESSFWVRYCKAKLETIKLSETAIPIQSSYTSINGISPRLECSESSLVVKTNESDAEISGSNERVIVSGSLVGFNTLDSFQKQDKNALLNDYFCPRFLEGDVGVLTSTLLITFADLKQHKVLYWFGVPALQTKPGKPLHLEAIPQPWREVTTHIERQTLYQSIEKMRLQQIRSGHGKGLPPYFLISKTKCHVLSREVLLELANSQSEWVKDVIFGFFDPFQTTSTSFEASQLATPENIILMGWPVRNLIAHLVFHTELGGKCVSLLSFRPRNIRRIHASDPMPDVHCNELYDDNCDQSIVVKVQLPLKQDYEWDSEPKYRTVGWELNARSKPGPRWVNLKPLLDGNHLAIQAADLNLRLMKWRMIPNLDVELLQSIKVLIIGAGTLGCSVARVLLGWGVRNFTFVDNGNVSYSNPVRQSLFTLEDCHFGQGAGRPKAVAAADALKQIAADVTSRGIVLSVPMPGHPDDNETITNAVEMLDQLVQECDVVYLLTDTRESRWLPTVMAATYNKVLINAALGLDSWLVMRHGGGINQGATRLDQQRLGCYYCNDVVAPENSTRNRTLDQQCTVTRPGLSPIASSMAVELMVALLHHPARLAAPAPAPRNSTFSPTISSAQDVSLSSALGIIPHQIRGSLVTYTMMTPTVPAFRCCTGCSPSIIKSYIQNPMELVLKTCQLNSGTSFLESLSGLTTFRADAAAKVDDVDGWDDDDEE